MVPLVNGIDFMLLQDVFSFKRNRAQLPLVAASNLMAFGEPPYHVGVGGTGKVVRQGAAAVSLACTHPLLVAADVPESKDPPGMKRYEGSEIIRCRAPKFDEYVVPVDAADSVRSPKVREEPRCRRTAKSVYVCRAGKSNPNRTASQLQAGIPAARARDALRKDSRERGWFGPTLEKATEEDALGQILA
jgi:hypothetical protein